MTAVNLPTVLETSNMLEIDGLYTFVFTLDQGLQITCMDGRAEKRWSFTSEQVSAAVFDETLQSWTLTSDSGEHRLVCMSGITGSNHDEDEDDADA
ncbi:MULTISPECIES: DUF5629 family protein [unclassified Pseudomonas]|uniref:DUF5629 family protein n=1 Tax=unclassified Pseudomonas TaxID=196821 RepID=UPI001474DEA8|nr:MULTISPECIES: DUF5629 family protein [unclassified Pseudomonas]NMX94203.1 DUF5629 family protein [Pseudomonas sp. WS 5086]NMY45207.1 DUF5629 family protein [Pseudomonas sp. WS 5027]